MFYPFRLFVLAWQFFTHIALPQRLLAWVGFDARSNAASVCMFPLVGACVGVVAAAAWWAAWWCVPRQAAASAWVCAWLAIGVSVWMTGALHEDGLADVADGLGAPVGRERALTIMKDSRVGGFAVLALVIVLGLKAAVLAALAQCAGSATAWALVVGHCASRLPPLVLMRLLPNVSLQGQSKSQAMSGLSHTGLLWAGVCVGAVVLAAAWLAPVWQGWQWGMGLAAMVLGGIYIYRLSRQRLQGYTGDVLGAMQQVGELCLYVGLLLAMSPRLG